MFVLLFLLVLGATNAHAKDVRLYKITKGILYRQSPGSAPALLPEKAYVFEANIVMGAPGSVLSAAIRSPEGTTHALEADGNDKLELRDRVNTRATLDARYPDGNFTYTINTRNEGQRVIRLPLSGGSYPSAPVVENLSALQSVNANGYVVVTWNRFANGGASDFIQLRIEESDGDLAWESRDYGEPGALDGTATRVIIEPGELKPGVTYAATLFFEKSSTRDNDSYSGALGLSTYHARTEFTIKTSADAAPNVERYELAKGRSFEQTNSAGPFPEPGDEFIFSAEARASAPNQISSASVIIPTGAVLPLAPDNDREEFDFSESVASQASLNAKYPAGNYIFQMQTASQGNRSVGLWFESGSFPPAPRLHFDPSRRLDPNSEFVLVWDAWLGGTRDDFIQLRLEDEDGDTVFETPNFDDKDALDGRATSVSIPAGTFVTGKDYKGRLTFRRYVRLDPFSYPGALGIASYFARTKFDIETARRDVEEYRIERGRSFEQASVGLPVPEPGDEFIFNAEVQGSAPNLISTAGLTTPVGARVSLQPNNGRDEFEFSDRVPTQAIFDSRYPAGSYAFVIQTLNEGARTISLNAPATEFPPAPHLQVDPTAKARPDQPLVVRWDAWTGGRASDFVQLRVEDNNGALLFETPDRGDSGALNGLSTSATVPAGVLAPGSTHEARLVFERVVLADNTTVPGADGAVISFSRTKFEIETIPPDVRGYEVFKGRVFVQTNAASAVVTGYVFTASIEADTAQSVATAAIITPTGRTDLLVQQSGGTEFKLEQARNSQAALDADYPDGNYILAINTVHDGGKNIPVVITGGAYPTPPRLSDYPAARRINSAAGFSLNWDAFANGGEKDYIDVRIREMDGDEVFDTKGYGDEEALDGRDTAVMVPAFALQVGRTYLARLHFEKVLRADDSGYPGADGRVGYSARTFVHIATDGPGNPPRLQNHRVLSDRRVQFNFTSLDGGTYHVQGSTNMIDWTTLGTVSSTANMSTFVAPPPPATGCYFYRALLIR